MKTGIKLFRQANEHGMKVYVNYKSSATVYTYAANIQDARLHFSTGTSVFYNI